MLRNLLAGSISLVLAAAVPSLALAQGEDDNRGNFAKKGSLLFIPNVELNWDASTGEIVRDTFIQLTNDGPSTVKVRLWMINGDRPVCDGSEPGCNSRDFVGTLTPEQPAYWAASTGSPGLGVPQSSVGRFDELDPDGRIDPNGSGRLVLRGAMIIYAVDTAEKPIRYNRLSASVTLIDYANASAYEYNATAFQSEAVNEGEHTDVNYDGEMDLDGTEYDYAPGKLLLEFYADSTAAADNTALSGAQSAVTVKVNTQLILFPVDNDTRDNVEEPYHTVTVADYVLHDQNENRRSFTSNHCVACYDNRFLSAIHPIFTRFFLQHDKGKARIDTKANSSACGDVDCDGATDLSVNTALLGVSVKVLTFVDNGGIAEAGSSLVGQETEAGWVRFEIPDGGGEIIKDKAIQGTIDGTTNLGGGRKLGGK